MLKNFRNINIEKQTRFLRSAMTLDGEFHSCEEVLLWVQSRIERAHVKVTPILLSEMKNWHLNRDIGKICHSTGKFFSIEGIEIVSSAGEVRKWRQPIINQPEIGYLGCLVKEFNGILYFLIQAKIEPGNINQVQLSPTLQATRSNYTQQHKGKVPTYLEYFNERESHNVLLDQLQSEQGARFLNKRNRNIIIEINDEIELHEDFIWLTLGQIKRLASVDNLINMDLRTVISGISYESIENGSVTEFCSMFPVSSFGVDMLLSGTNSNFALFSLEEIISWFTELKAKNDLDISKISLLEMSDWNVTEEGIFHRQQLYFDVIWTSVEIWNREVASWSQPLIHPRQEGLIAFIIKKIDGVFHFLVQAKIECGNFDIFEFAPTVQCLTGSYKNSLDSLPYLKYVLGARSDQVRYSTLQSEEGGRFYHEQNRNLIIEADNYFPLESPANYKWMTLSQLFTFIKFNNYLNIQARSLIAGIRFE